jgi:anti-sigma factor RsiW
MIDRDSPVTEDELHAYIDGELPADRMEAVTAWLAAHQEQAVTVASWRAQSERIRARFGAVLEEVVPERLTLDQIIRNDRANGRSWKIFAAAAAVIALRMAPLLARAPARLLSQMGHSMPTGSMSSRCVIRSKCRAPNAST